MEKAGAENHLSLAYLPNGPVCDVDVSVSQKLIYVGEVRPNPFRAL